MSIVHKHSSRRDALRGLTLTGLALAAVGLAPAARAKDVTRTFKHAGIFTFVDPTGVTSLSISLNGGGGSAGIRCHGGSGAFLSGTLFVTPGTTYNVLVGSGGAGDFRGGGFGGGGTGLGGGGGRSAIQTAGGLDLVDVGGGGGGGISYNGGYGGGSQGGRGSDDGSSSGGGGGTQTAGGGSLNGGRGGAFTGGNGGVGGFGGEFGGGGGGGGYYGGGGGSSDAGSGGGGGSSYTSGPSFALASETDGGAQNADGGAGSVTLSYMTHSAPVPEASSGLGLGVCLLGFGLLGVRARKKVSA